MTDNCLKVSVAITPISETDRDRLRGIRNILSVAEAELLKLECDSDDLIYLMKVLQLSMHDKISIPKDEIAFDLLNQSFDNCH